MNVSEIIAAGLQLVLQRRQRMLGGVQQALKTTRQGRTTLAVLANNGPASRKSGIEHSALLAKAHVPLYSRSAFESDTPCGKSYRACKFGLGGPDTMRKRPGQSRSERFSSSIKTSQSLFLKNKNYRNNKLWASKTAEWQSKQA